MYGKLFLYTFALVLLLFSLFAGIALLLGKFSFASKQTSASLSIHLMEYEQDLTTFFDHVAARGIKMSLGLDLYLSDWLNANGMEFSRLNGNPGAIMDLTDGLYETLYRWLTLTDCSGAFFFLDATVNTDIPKAGRSKCGIYIKIANVNIQRPADFKPLLYRGNTELGRARKLELHNHWALEFNMDNFPEYDKLMKEANRNLNTCFLFTDPVKLPGTWENVMLLCVPIVGQDGKVYGVCGFEISELYFKLRFAHSGATARMTGMLARYNANEIDADRSFVNGDRTGYYINFSGALSVSPMREFQIYKTDENFSFIGMQKPIRLSPLERERAAIVMIPKGDYDAINTRMAFENIVIGSLLILSAVFGSIFMSKKYVEPILSGLSNLKEGGYSENTGLTEIDDLFEYLAALDGKRKALDEERKTLGEEVENLTAELERARRQPAALSPAAVLEDAAPNRADYEQFLKNLKTLTTMERAVFNLYTKGKTARQIADALFVSDNTIKFHNKNIYKKLGVSSLKALKVFINMMREIQDEV
jgi:DNA-binding CsgD family transcriptional regulator